MQSHLSISPCLPHCVSASDILRPRCHFRTHACHCGCRGRTQGPNANRSKHDGRSAYFRSRVCLVVIDHLIFVSFVLIRIFCFEAIVVDSIYSDCWVQRERKYGR
jgi:hypothetical protein